jgi:DNA uptake protein ComE-like DNA-binding protein
MNRRLGTFTIGTLALALLAGCGGADDDAAPVGDAPETAAPAPAADSAALATGPLINPNEATREQLLALPGIEPTLADALINARPYQNMLEVDQMLALRLDEAQREAVYNRLWYPIDLNTASGEEILLIPGIGERMEHEFQEYRPYRGIEQFRTEIGKYVDEQEVARLERYVTIR